MALASDAAIIVVNYGSSDLLAANLVTVQAEVPGAAIVVVDNFTTAAERERVLELGRAHGWRVLTPDENLGFGAGVNRAAEVAVGTGATELVLLNPDAAISADAFAELARVSATHRRAILAPVIVRPDGRTWFDGMDVLLDDGSMRASRNRGGSDRPFHPWLTGACLWIPVDVWRELGGFGEDFFLYWEDVDLSRRALDRGIDLIVVRTATAVHDPGGTQHNERSAGKSPVYYYYSIRNRLVYAARHLDPHDVRAWRRTSVRQASEVLLRGGKRQFLRPVVPLRAAWRGLRDGLRASRR